jgi:hypothetical protein
MKTKYKEAFSYLTILEIQDKNLVNATALTKHSIIILMT